MTTRGRAIATVLALGAALQAHAASQSAAVSGVVRDEQGMPQAGVLVELLSSARSLTTFTDHRGRFFLQGLAPGQYQIRATATLFLPTLRPHLEVRGGTSLLVNLTLAGLRSEAAWLSPGLHAPGQTEDDWKWTLRSPVNRPLLRLVDEDRGALETPPAVEQKVRVLADVASGVFGGSGAGATFEVARREARTGGTIVLGLTQRTADAGRVTGLRGRAAITTGDAGSAMQRVAVANLSEMPLVRAGGQPVTVAQFGAAERMLLGDLATVEAGSLTEVVRAGATAAAVRPFLAVRSQVPGGWVLGYRLASTPEVAGFDDVSREGKRVPGFAVAADGAPEFSGGVHQELLVAKQVGRLKVQAGLHHEGQQRTTVVGQADPRVAGLLAQTGGWLVDSSNGMVRTLGPGFASTGGSVSAEVAVSDHLRCSGAYLNGRGLVAQGGIGQMVARRSQGALVAVQGTVLRSGTRVAVAYRWQPSEDVTVVSPYTASDTMPYLGVSLRQPLARRDERTMQTEIVVDGGNLLNEGAHQVTTPQGNLLLASALREIRAGLAVTF